MRKQDIFTLKPVQALWHANRFKIWHLYELMPFWPRTYFRRKYINKKYFWPLFSGRVIKNNRKDPWGSQKGFFNQVCTNYTGQHPSLRRTIFNKKYHGTEKWHTSYVNSKQPPKNMMRLSVVKRTQNKKMFTR